MIKTRFAPSPTGYLHIGASRTALYCWLYAKQTNGIFALRIEDTDTARSTQESTKQILKSMSYLGLDYQEGPIYQSQRLKIYQKHIQKLLSENKAYQKDGAIFFKINTQKDITWDDQILGTINIPKEELKDFVIQKSNGWPVYHFAVVIDDALMKITHVIRGMDHTTNTAKHILLFQALGYDIPQFAHIPMILGSDKQKLSKRHGALGVDDYEKQGILPEALINFLARLGWGYENQEIFTPEELIKKFDLTKVSKNPAIFDPKKLLWLNAQHINKLSTDQLILKLNQFFKTDFSKDKSLIEVLKPRSQTLIDIQNQLNAIKNRPTKFDSKLLEQILKNQDLSFIILEKLTNALKTITIFNHQNIDSAIISTAEKLSLKPGKLLPTLRLALTGQTKGPGIHELLEIIGQEETIHRLLNFQKKFKKS